MKRTLRLIGWVMLALAGMFLTTAGHSRVMAQATGGDVSGCIVLADQTPLVDIAVIISPLDEFDEPDYDALVESYTDEDGCFSFSALEAGDYYLESKWGPQFVEAHVSIAAGADVDLGDLLMPTPAKRITGQVTAGAQAIGGAEVEAYDYESDEVAYALTDGAGRFTMAVWGSTWEVWVLSGDGDTWADTSPPRLVHFQDDTSAETHAVTLTVTPTDSQVQARLLTPAGAPVTTGAWLTLSDDEAEYEFWASVNAQGYFSVPAMMGRYDVLVEIDEDLYPNYSAPSVPLIEVVGATMLGDLTLLVNDAVISGAFTDADQQPVAGVGVGAWSILDYESHYTETDAQGHYQLQVPAGQWVVWPILDETPYLAAVPEMGWVTATVASATVANFSVTLPAWQLQGSVVDEEGTLLTEVEAQVYARVGDAAEYINVTDVIMGKFRLDLPAGAVSVGLVLPEGSPYHFAGEVQVSESSIQPLVLSLAENDARIQGTLRNAQGQAITNMVGYVYAYPAASTAAVQGVQLAADGTYELWVAPGEWTLDYELYTETYVDSTLQPVTAIIAAEQMLTHDFTLLALDGIITGQVLLPNGQPKPGAYISVKSQDATYQDYATTTQTGQFSVSVPLSLGPMFIIDTAARKCSAAEIETETCLLDPVSQEITATARNAAHERQPTAFATLAFVGNFEQGSIVTIVGVNGTAEAWNDHFRRGGNGLFLVIIPVTRSEVGQSVTVGHWMCVFWFQCNYYQTNFINIPPPSSQSIRSTQIVITPTMTTLTDTLPMPKVATIRVAAGWSHTLADGTRLQIPPHAIVTDEDFVHIVVEPKMQLLGDSHYQTASIIYAITLREAESGQRITQDLRGAMLVNMPYTARRLSLLHVADETELRPALYASELWQPATSYQLDTTAQRVSFRTNKVGDWALVVPNVRNPYPTIQRIYMPVVIRSN